MNDRQDAEAWADALLDQHRTAPKGSAAPREPVRYGELPWMVKLSVRTGGDMPDRDQLERIQRAAGRHRRVANMEAVVWIVAMVVAVVAVVGIGHLA